MTSDSVKEVVVPEGAEDWEMVGRGEIFCTPDWMYMSEMDRMILRRGRKIFQLLFEKIIKTATKRDEVCGTHVYTTDTMIFRVRGQKCFRYCCGKKDSEK